MMDKTSSLRTAVFSGSFNPFTIGHKSIADRALDIFDRLVICIGYNENKDDTSSLEERIESISRLYASDPRVEVVAWHGLMADLARRQGARFIVRGVRDASDFDYEKRMADINRRIAGIETVFLPAIPGQADISSSAVRELEHFGYDVSEFLP